MTGTRRWIAVVALLLVLAGAAVAFLVRGTVSPDADRAAPMTSTSPSASPSSTERPVTPEVVFLGDSWTVGVGATAGQGYAPLVAEQLGWEYEELGVSGSGYLSPGAAAPYADRIDAAVAVDPDLIVVQGSLNDSRSDPGQLDRAAADTLARLQATAGDGRAVLVIGAPDTPGTDPAVIERINAAIAAAAGAAGFAFVNPAQENWTDPADPAIWADPLHPNDAGHRLLAEALVPLLQAALDG